MSFIQKWLQAASGLFNTVTGAQAVQLVDDSGAPVAVADGAVVTAIVGVKDASGTQINPAAEDGNLAAIKAAVQAPLAPTVARQRVSFHAGAGATTPIVAAVAAKVVTVYELVLTAGTASGSAQLVDTSTTPAAVSAALNLGNGASIVRPKDLVDPYYATTAGKGLQVKTVGCSVDGELLYSQS